MGNGSTLIQHSLSTGTFGYSAADIDYLTEHGATEYTLVTLVVDESPSVEDFKAEMEECIKRSISACKMSPRSDFLMVRLVAFSSRLREIHGFKQLVDINVNDYDGCLKTSGATLLYDSAKNSIDATCAYGKDLVENDFDVNAIVIIITDGMDNCSSGNPSDVADSLKAVKKEESLESLLTILVGVGVDQYSGIGQYLDDFKVDAGITQYIELKDADEKTLAKLADFISRSVSSQSQSLGTKACSQQLQI